ncbi:unnamed protein product [Cylindrotheca closterium]|uniref:Rhodanese domain-containing protein n=1 Tax=Cylindrotheca closterium TaxID=2856 RepID=A0AAD2CI49_9STRA|nr:unnamed protein product [Cylindrotheca closterium]
MTQEENQVILFYKYHPLSGDRTIVEEYRSALESLCQELKLEGRILVGCNEHQSEGINGTLSGSMENVQTFVHAMCQYPFESATANNKTTGTPILTEHPSLVQTFWKQCQQFYANAKCEPLIMTSAEFKWSSSKNESNLFPDLNIKVVKELIGTGGVLASIPLEEVHQGYLTPKEWHERIAKYKEQEEDDTVLIDCRNTKEFQIGHFPNSLDPNTTTFNQFPLWVKKHSQTLANKKVLMYCTGGIRCEKASAYIRRTIPNVQEVNHLKGGIHKYLDEYGKSNDCLWEGKNFVFDGRGAHKASETAGSSSTTCNDDNDGDDGDDQASAATLKPTSPIGTNATYKVVGSCTYCAAPYDTFDPKCVCTVCNEPTLICLNCQPLYTEYHCKNHQHLKNCYFSNLSEFSFDQLHDQLAELQLMLEEIAVGRKFKQKRKTLKRQCNKIISRIEELQGSDGNNSSRISTESSSQSLKRTRVLTENQRIHADKPAGTTNGGEVIKSAKRRNNAHLQEQKEQLKQKFVRELQSLGLFQPASAYVKNGIRLPPPCTRVLWTNTKGKWCGKALLYVLQMEFAELSENDRLAEIMQKGLLALNDVPITSLEQAESIRLKNMDVISRITHWNEPPVRIPNGTINVQKIALPQNVLDEYSFLEEVSSSATVIVCDKPSTVPVHPAGPYLANSLTIMVEAQEGLEPKSLIPCHRIDRVTSGLTICCTDAKIARLIQGRIEEGSVKKQYLAMVQGQFPSSLEELNGSGPICTDLAQWEWKNEEKTIKVNGPIETVDPSNGIRKITAKGKPSSSLFQLISYDSQSKTSIISCCPLTGRSHQLRVHLQWLGYPIMDDIQYDGKRLDDELTTTMEGYDRVVQAMEKLQEQPKEEGLAIATTAAEEGLTPAQVQAAIETSSCARDVTSAFTPSQLLQGGHAICLHAYRYQIPFFAKGSKQHKKKDKQQGDDHPSSSIANLDLQVPLPTWGTSVDTAKIQWLK